MIPGNRTEKFGLKEIQNDLIQIFLVWVQIVGNEIVKPSVEASTNTVIHAIIL